MDWLRIEKEGSDMEELKSGQTTKSTMTKNLYNQMAEDLVAFKKKAPRETRNRRCPFWGRPNPCFRCRFMFSNLVVLSDKIVSGDNTGLKHGCPCHVYSFRYVQQTVRNFIKKWGE